MGRPPRGGCGCGCGGGALAGVLAEQRRGHVGTAHPPVVGRIEDEPGLKQGAQGSVQGAQRAARLRPFLVLLPRSRAVARRRRRWRVCVAAIVQGGKWQTPAGSVQHPAQHEQDTEAAEVEAARRGRAGGRFGRTEHRVQRPPRHAQAKPHKRSLNLGALQRRPARSEVAEEGAKRAKLGPHGGQLQQHRVQRAHAGPRVAAVRLRGGSEWRLQQDVGGAGGGAGG